MSGKKDEGAAVKTSLCAIAMGLTVWAGASKSAVIGFDAFNNYRQPAFTGLSEDGFAVRVTKGDWREAFYFGSSAPSIFSRSVMGEIEIEAEDRSSFRAQSVDIGNGALFAGAVDFIVEGFSGSQSIFVTQGRMTDLDAFNMVSLDNSQVIDRLVIGLTSDGAASFNIDNITVDPTSLPRAIPLPATMTLMLFAGAVLFGLRQRR